MSLNLAALDEYVRNYRGLVESLETPAMLKAGTENLSKIEFVAGTLHNLANDDQRIGWLAAASLFGQGTWSSVVSDVRRQLDHVVTPRDKATNRVLPAPPEYGFDQIDGPVLEGAGDDRDFPMAD